MDQENSHQILQDLLAKNKECFDCQAERPIECVSLNNGVFLCGACGDKHSKSLEDTVSRVIRIDRKMDWSNDELNYLIMGGNQNIATYYQQFNLPLDIDIELKYKTKCSFYYRYQLHCLVTQSHDTLQLAPLQLGDALDIIESYQFHQMLQQAHPDSDPQPQDVLMDGINLLNQGATMAYQHTKQIYQHEKTQQILSQGKQLGQNLFKQGKDIYQAEKTQEILNQGKEKLVSINNKMKDAGVYSTIQNKGQQGFEFLKGTGQQIYESESTKKVVEKIKDNEYVQQVKGGLTSGWGWVTGKLKGENKPPAQEHHQDPLLD